MAKNVDERAKKIINEKAFLEGKRANFDSIWRDCAKYVFPRMNQFDGKTPDSNSRKKQSSVVYGKPQQMLPDFASVYDNMNTPSSQRWHGLTIKNKKQLELEGVREWLEEIVDILFAERYNSKANFSSQNYERYISLGLFGTGIMVVSERSGGGLSYKSEHLAGHYLMENEAGIIDRDLHCFTLKGYQAIERYGDELPAETRNKAGEKPNDEFHFIQKIEPNKNYVPDSLNPKELKFSSEHVCELTKTVFRSSGMDTFRRSISRYVTIPNDVYGTSPTALALPDIKMGNEMQRTNLVSKKLRGLPPVLTRNDGVITPVGGGKMEAGKLIKGGLDANGNPMVRPYISGADPVAIESEIERTDALMEQVYLAELFKLLTETKRMTAFEVMSREQEKGQKLSPIMGREQHESLSMLIESEIEILARQGKLPPPPSSIADQDVEYDVVYTSPLAKAQKAEEANGALRTAETAIQLAQIDPTVKFRVNFDAVIKLVNEANSGNNTIMNDDATYNALVKQDQEQQMAMMAIQMQQEAQGEDQ